MNQKRSRVSSNVLEEKAVTCTESRAHRHIVQELQKETLAINQRNKLLEAENRLLISELKILDDNVEQGLLKQEAALDAGDSSSVLPLDLQKKHEVKCDLNLIILDIMHRRVNLNNSGNDLRMER